MSAKKPKAGAAPAVSVPSPAPATAETGEPAAWLESRDPRKRLWGRISFIALWAYVAALWLPALDQTFHWGIFGPKVPPLP